MAVSTSSRRFSTLVTLSEPEALYAHTRWRCFRGSTVLLELCLIAFNRSSVVARHCDDLLERRAWNGVSQRLVDGAERLLETSESDSATVLTFVVMRGWKLQ